MNPHLFSKMLHYYFQSLHPPLTFMVLVIKIYSSSPKITCLSLIDWIAVIAGMSTKFLPRQKQQRENLFRNSMMTMEKWTVKRNEWVGHPPMVLNINWPMEIPEHTHNWFPSPFTPSSLHLSTCFPSQSLVGVVCTQLTVVDWVMMMQGPWLMTKKMHSGSLTVSVLSLFLSPSVNWFYWNFMVKETRLCPLVHKIHSLVTVLLKEACIHDGQKAVPFH